MATTHLIGKDTLTWRNLLFNFLKYDEEYESHISLIFNPTDDNFFCAHNHVAMAGAQLILWPSGKFMYDEVSNSAATDLEEALGV